MHAATSSYIGMTRSLRSSTRISGPFRVSAIQAGVGELSSDARRHELLQRYDEVLAQLDANFGALQSECVATVSLLREHAMNAREELEVGVAFRSRPSEQLRSAVAVEPLCAEVAAVRERTRSGRAENRSNQPRTGGGRCSKAGAQISGGWHPSSWRKP
jgi:hypothetical protein